MQNRNEDNRVIARILEYMEGLYAEAENRFREHELRCKEWCDTCTELDRRSRDAWRAYGDVTRIIRGQDF